MINMYSRASDRVRKKITNYAEIFRNIMRKKVLIMRKTRWIMRKIFGSLRLPKLTSFHAPKIELPPKANFKQKKYILVFGLFQLFSFVFGMLGNYLINYVMFNENNTTVILLAEVDFLLQHCTLNLHLGLPPCRGGEACVSQ